MRRALARDLPGFDLLHLHSLYLFHDWAAGNLAMRIAKPYLVRPHGSLDPYIFRRHRLKKAIFDLWFQNRVLAGASAIHYTAKRRCIWPSPTSHGAPGVVIPNGIDPADYAQLPPQGTFRARHPEIGDRQILLFLSRINFKKGLDILAGAVGRLKRDDVHLVIAGPDGGYLAETRRFVAEAGIAARTTFTGMLTGQDKLAAFADAALFVLPSYSENFGIAVVEAMACGVPVLISDKVNIWREVVADGAGHAAPCDAARLCRRNRGDAGRSGSAGRHGCSRARRPWRGAMTGRSSPGVWKMSTPQSSRAGAISARTADMNDGHKPAMRCLLCGSELVAVLEQVFDTRFGLPGTYTIHGCRRCGLEHTLPRPEQDELNQPVRRALQFRRSNRPFLSRPARSAAFAADLSPVDGDRWRCELPFAGAAMAGCWMWAAMKAAGSPSIAPTDLTPRGWS